MSFVLRYFFEVAHELTFSTGVVPCLLKIQLKPYHRRDYPYRPEVYLEIRNRTDEDGRILPNVFFECFGGPDVYNDIALLTNNNEDHGTRRREARNEDPLRTYDIDVIDSEDFVNVFEIWLSIDKNYKTKMHLDTEYKYKYCEYFKSLAEIRHFKYVQMRAFVSVMIPGKGPSHQVKPYFTQAVSEGQILDMIGQQGGIHSWFPDLMKRLFPR